MHSESHHFTLMISSHLHTLTEVTFPFTSCSLCMPLANVIMCYAVKFTQFQFTYHQTCQEKNLFWMNCRDGGEWLIARVDLGKRTPMEGSCLTACHQLFKA